MRSRGGGEEPIAALILVHLSARSAPWSSAAATSSATVK